MRLEERPFGGFARGSLPVGCRQCTDGSKMVLFVTGIKWTEVAVAGVLSSTAPLFALPLGLIFLRERVTGSAVAGTVITLVGLAILQL